MTREPETTDADLPTVAEVRGILKDSETAAETIRSAVVDAVQSADRAGELCSCKAEDRLIESLTYFLTERPCGGSA